MALTYLDIVNAVLRDTNEVPLTPTQFINARGFHAFVKEAVNRALMDIVNSSTEWPWLANVPLNAHVSAHSNEIQTERRKVIYQLPSDVMEVDWDSIILTDMRGKETRTLRPISYEEWAHYGNADVLSNRDDADLGQPTVIYKTKDGHGFGLSPVPDKAYRIQFITYKAPQFLTLHSDTLPFPDRWYTVLVHRARYFAWMFRQNPQQAQMAFQDYQTGLKEMKQAMIKPIFSVMRVR